MGRSRLGLPPGSGWPRSGGPGQEEEESAIRGRPSLVSWHFWSCLLIGLSPGECLGAELIRGPLTFSATLWNGIYFHQTTYLGHAFISFELSKGFATNQKEKSLKRSGIRKIHFLKEFQSIVLSYYQLEEIPERYILKKLAEMGWGEPSG